MGMGSLESKPLKYSTEGGRLHHLLINIFLDFLRPIHLRYVLAPSFNLIHVRVCVFFMMVSL